MAYVIAVCGAGGKTTLCNKLAKKYLDDNKKVCIITTTHMWKEFVIDDIKLIVSSQDVQKKVYHFGNVDGEKLVSVDKNDYEIICSIFDYVIIEADGSRNKPIKIPNLNKEPVIPDNTDEIIVVSGLGALGRKLGVVCHRFEEFENDEFIKSNNYNFDTIVDEKIIDNIANHYYKQFVEKKEKEFAHNIKFSTLKIDMTKSCKFCNINNVAMVLCAAGLSKRFGSENKLLVDVGNVKYIDEYKSYVSDGNKLLYQYMIEKMCIAKDLLIEKFDRELDFEAINVDLAVVASNDFILDDSTYNKEVHFIKNDDPDLGLSNTIKIATKSFENHDAIVFVNADIPNLNPKELSLFMFNSICSNSSVASMFVDIPKNPAYFEKEHFEELKDIVGDKGPKEILYENFKTLYKYHIDEKELFDIDTEEDFDKYLSSKENEN